MHARQLGRKYHNQHQPIKIEQHNSMKILSSLLAFASLASLGMGCAFTLALGPIPALVGFAGFVALGVLAVYLNPEL
jgi:hypothetical protein